MKKGNKINLRGKVVVIKECRDCQDTLLVYAQQQKCDICGGKLVKIKETK